MFRNEHFQLIENEHDSEPTDDDDNEEFNLTSMDNDTENHQTTAKWIGCANHLLQLVLKVLDLDTTFNSILSAITYILATIRKSSNAVRDFTDLAGCCVVLPNNTR